MQRHNDDPLTYRFRYRQTPTQRLLTVAHGLLVVGLGVGIGLYIAINRSADPLPTLIVVGSFLVVFIAYFAFWTVAGQMGTSDIQVGPSGIAWSVFGRAWKLLRWQDVQEVRITTRLNKAFGMTYTRYEFRTHTKKFNGFWSGGDFAGYEEFDTLLATINGYLEQYAIRVADERGAAPLYLNTIPVR